MSALSGHGTLVSSGQHPAIIKHFPADVRGLAGSVCHHGLCLGKGLGQFVVDIIKRHAAVDIAGGNHSLQYTAVLVAGTVRFVGRAPLMLSFVKQPTLRVCGRYRHRFCPFAAFFRRASFFFEVLSRFFPPVFGGPSPHQAASSHTLPGLRSPPPGTALPRSLPHLKSTEIPPLLFPL